MAAKKFLVTLFLICLTFSSNLVGNAQAASSPLSIQQFFKTPEESSLHWKTCINHTGGVLVLYSGTLTNNIPTWTPNGTLMVDFKIENEQGTTIYGTTQAHVVADKGKDPTGRTPYAAIQVWFRTQQFDAKIIKFSPKPLDLALLKVFIPKTWSASEPLYNGIRTYREMVDSIIPVKFEPDIIPEESDTFWMVGYGGGGIPRRVLTRFLWYAPADANDPFGLYFFVLEEGHATGGHSGSYILDSSCKIVIGGLSEGLNEGEGIIALQSSAIQNFISDGLKKENIVWP